MSKMKSVFGSMKIREFTASFIVPQDVIKYLQQSIRGLSDLRLIGIDCDDISNGGTPDECIVTVRPFIENLKFVCRFNQSVFESYCSREIKKFFETLCAETAEFDAQSLTNLKRIMNYKTFQGILNVAVSENQMVEVYISWRLQWAGKVQVSGKCSDVAAVLSYFKENCSTLHQTETFDLLHCRALRDCGVLDVAANDFGVNVAMSEDNLTGDITITGQHVSVIEAFTQIKSRVMKLDTVPEIVCRSKYIQMALRNGNDVNDVAKDMLQIISNMLRSREICASIQYLAETLYIYYCLPADLEKAVQALLEVVHHETIQLKSGFSEILNTDEWAQFKEQICTSRYTLCYPNMDEQVIHCVSVSDEITNATKEITEYLEENVDVAKPFYCSPMMVMYLKKYETQVIKNHPYLKNTRLKFYAEQNLIRITTKFKHVANVRSWLYKLQGKFIFYEQSVTFPGMRKFLKGTEGRQTVEAISASSHCMGLIDYEAQKMPLKPDLKLEIEIGDISTSQVDVIVASATKGFFSSCANPAIITKFLIERAGHRLQAACEASKQNNLSIGDVVVTPGYNLLCEEVYHVILSCHRNKSCESILRKAIARCLDMADCSGYTSIAFSALGAGGFKFPAKVVIDSLHVAVRKCKAKHLSSVRLIVLESNNQLISQMKSYVPTPKILLNSEHETIHVYLEEGEIFDSNCEAMVHVYGSALGRVAGVNVEENPIVEMTNLKVTTGGNLFKYVFRAVIPYPHFSTRGRIFDWTSFGFMTRMHGPCRQCQVLLECFREADRLGVNDLAIPLLETGTHYLEAECVLSSVDQFNKTKPKYLERVELFAPDFHTSTNVRREYHLRGRHKGYDLPSWLTARQESFSRLLFCSLEPQNVTKAVKALKDLIEEKCKTETIQDDTFNHLTCKEVEEMKNVEDLNVWKETNSEIAVQGLRQDVDDFLVRLKDVINELNQDLQCNEYVSWTFLEPLTNEEMSFSMRANRNLEKAYEENGWNGSAVISSEVKGKMTEFTVDFSKNVAKTEDSEFKIRRILRDAAPSSWEDMGGESYKKVVVSPRSSEFKETIQKFTATLQLEPFQLERIQNPTLWHQFYVQKRKIEKKMPGMVVARQLFHGTDANIADKILKEGFDRSYAGKNATKYGKGVYFATTAKYSNSYTAKDHKCMFLAEVITGNYCKGNSSMKAAPAQNDGSPYDSVVDNVSQPKIFVVFRDASVYPSYLLTYK